MNIRSLVDLPPWEWPDDASDLVLKALRDSRADASDRLIAADLAGEVVVMDDEVAMTLLSMAQDDDEPVELRAQALISLGPVLEYSDSEEFDDPDEVPISEETFLDIQESLRRLYLDARVPADLRRYALESSVRAPMDWHPGAVRAAYLSGDDSWGLTAVFCMRFVPGFNEQILEALRSGNDDIHFEAVCAAGDWGIEEAWSHVRKLVSTAGTDKELLLAAMDAVASIRPGEAARVLQPLTESEDEDIVDAAYEAIAAADAYLAAEDEDSFS